VCVTSCHRAELVWLGSFFEPCRLTSFPFLKLLTGLLSSVEFFMSNLRQPPKIVPTHADSFFVFHCSVPRLHSSVPSLVKFSVTEEPHGAYRSLLARSGYGIGFSYPLSKSGCFPSPIPPNTRVFCGRQPFAFGDIPSSTLPPPAWRILPLLQFASSLWPTSFFGPGCVHLQPPQGGVCQTSPFQAPADPTKPFPSWRRTLFELCGRRIDPTLGLQNPFRTPSPQLFFGSRLPL